MSSHPTTITARVNGLYPRFAGQLLRGSNWESMELSRRAETNSCHVDRVILTVACN